MVEHVSHSLVQSLRDIPDFSEIDEVTLLSFVGESMNLFWKGGSAIFEPGDLGDALYVVISGDVSIQDPDGREIFRYRSGTYFGEMSLLLNAVHSKRALAVTDSEIMVVPKESFRSILDSDPELAEYFGRVLEGRQKKPAAEARA